MIFWVVKRRVLLLFIGFILVLLLLVLWPRMFFIIESGHAGVVYRTFWGGTVTEVVRDEGLQIISPWNTLTIYDVRLQQVEQQFTVISNNGLEVEVLLSIRYFPKPELLGLLHKKIGPDYLSKIVIPDVHSLVRGTFGQYTPEEIYTTKRSLIQETFQSALSNLGDKYVVMDNLLIKSIKLPEMIRVAIENKHVEEQRMLEMHFRISRERQEAERREIEANGVDRFQTIVSRSLNSQLLQYKAIDAMAKLAESSNSKLVLAGGGSNGIPLILDTSTGSKDRDESLLKFGVKAGIGESSTTPVTGSEMPIDPANSPGTINGDTPETAITATPGAEATPAASPAPSPENREKEGKDHEKEKSRFSVPSFFKGSTSAATPSVTPVLSSQKPAATPELQSEATPSRTP